MSHNKDHIEQEINSMTVPRRTLTALDRTTALALLGITVIFLFLFVLFWVTSGQVILPVLALVLVFASTAGFVATGVRWASVLGSLVALAAMIFLFVLPLGGSTLRHPTTDVARFSELVLIYALAAVALVAGVAAAIQNHRGTDQHAPRWLGSLLAGLASLAAGMIVVALLAAASPQSSNATMGGMPTVHMIGSNFLTNVVLGASDMSLDLALMALPEGSPPPTNATGHDHLALRYPSRRELARAYRQLLECGIELLEATDYGTNQSLYCSDPDGNGIELYWQAPLGEGQLPSQHKPLDLARLLAELDTPEPPLTDITNVP